MMKPYLMVRDSDNLILGVMWHDDPEAGPVKPQAEAPHGVTLVSYSGEFSREGRDDRDVAKYVGGEVVWCSWVDAVTLEELKREQKAKITQEKIKANQSYFMFQGKKVRYLLDDKTQIDAIHAVVLATGQMPVHSLWKGAWKADDNSWIPIPDVATWFSFVQAIADTGIEFFYRSETLKAMVDAATQVEQVTAITWDAQIESA